MAFVCDVSTCSGRGLFLRFNGVVDTPTRQRHVIVLCGVALGGVHCDVDLDLVGYDIDFVVECSQ